MAEEIYHVVPILFVNYRHYIKWHSMPQWRQFLNKFPNFPNAVGMIDGTIHQVRRPSGPLQAEFYRGDKRCHFMSSQLIVDADGLIVLLVTGYSIDLLHLYNTFLLEENVHQYQFNKNIVIIWHCVRNHISRHFCTFTGF